MPDHLGGRAVLREVGAVRVCEHAGDARELVGMFLGCLIKYPGPVLLRVVLQQSLPVIDEEHGREAGSLDRVPDVRRVGRDQHRLCVVGAFAALLVILVDHLDGMVASWCGAQCAGSGRGTRVGYGFRPASSEHQETQDGGDPNQRTRRRRGEVCLPIRGPSDAVASHDLVPSSVADGLPVVGTARDDAVCPCGGRRGPPPRLRSTASERIRRPSTDQTGSWRSGRRAPRTRWVPLGSCRTWPADNAMVRPPGERARVSVEPHPRPFDPGMRTSGVVPHIALLSCVGHTWVAVPIDTRFWHVSAHGVCVGRQSQPCCGLGCRGDLDAGPKPTGRRRLVALEVRRPWARWCGRSAQLSLDSASEISVLVAGWSMTARMAPSEPTNANPTSWVSP